MLQKRSGQLSQQEALPRTSSPQGWQQPARADVRAVSAFCTPMQPLLCLCQCLATGLQAGETKASSSISMLSPLRLLGRWGKELMALGKAGADWRAQC